MSDEIPDEAITAGVKAIHAIYGSDFLHPELLKRDVSDVVTAAAPAIRAAASERITDLQNLAGAMLASFTRTDDGYRCRVGQVQIARWRATLDGEQP
jgi:hypothetical protein